MSGFLNRKISTKIGIIVLLLIGGFFGWLIIREYKELMEMRLPVLEAEKKEISPY